MGVFFEVEIGEMAAGFFKEDLPCCRVPFFGGDAISDSYIRFTFRDAAELGGSATWSDRFEALLVPGNLFSFLIYKMADGDEGAEVLSDSV